VILHQKEFKRMSAQTQNKKSSSLLELNKEHLLGVWHLSAYEGRSEDGSITYPFTPKPEGMLTYHADGSMMVIIMKPDRPLFKSNDFSTGSDAEVRAAYEGLLAYCGRFVLDVQAGTVTHIPEQAHFPNWIGTPLVRFAELTEGQLSLSTPPTLSDGKLRKFYLIWKR
jgi:hypothetical protein